MPKTWNPPRFMVIDHIGIVIRSLEKALKQWEVLFGYRRNSDIVAE
jgi:hypothetical protein